MDKNVQAFHIVDNSWQHAWLNVGIGNDKATGQLFGGEKKSSKVIYATKALTWTKAHS